LYILEQYHNLFEYFSRHFTTPPPQKSILVLKKVYTVKLVLRGHLWDKEKVVLQVRRSLKRGSIHMKFSMSGQENLTFKYRGLLNRGDQMGRFDCINGCQ
jgi:hypothetical protein